MTSTAQTWTAPDVGLPEGPLTGDERPILEGYVAWHRAYLLHKCAGEEGHDGCDRGPDPERAGGVLAERLASHHRRLSSLRLRSQRATAEPCLRA